jgi:crotonobetainyl-CoA:carnitine CoA-transferase CaiB-like acyl-CoA transferase
MYELCVQQMRAAYVNAGSGAARLGNADAGVFHQGVYAAEGADRWIAITFHTVQEWARFAELHGMTGPDAPTRDAALADWCAPQRDAEAVEVLQRLGIAAATVQDMEDLVERDPLIEERHTLLPLVHPVLGIFGHMRTPIDFSVSRPHPFRAPSMGEHNRHIAAALCGLSAARIDELEQLGVFK